MSATTATAARPITGPAAASQAAAAPPRRPLYLGPALRGRVDVDGPALRVRADQRAEARFPFDRVSRIIAGVRVGWSADALRACLEHAIPIVIVGADGLPLGSVQPARLRTAPLTDALAELLDRPDGRDIYGCWLRAARMRVLADWRRSCAAQGEPPDPGVYRALVRKHVYRRAATLTAPQTTGLWRGALFALAAATVARWGLPPLMWACGGHALDLRHDLAELLELRLRLEVREENEAALEGEGTMLLVFQSQVERLEVEARRALGSLARRVNEVLTEWR